jgi:hypothetical protein
MERAIAALHDGDLERARYWLSEHERRFPNGLLARERFRALARAEQQARGPALLVDAWPAKRPQSLITTKRG